MTYEEGGPELQGLPEVDPDQNVWDYLDGKVEVAEVEQESHDKLPGPWYLWTGLGLVVLGLVVRWVLKRR